ncbi:MAG TPA: peptidylprolyl isomerase [Chthoniobacterales bacterium]
MRFLTLLAILFSTATALHAQLGPDVAVFQIQFGRDKALQQVVIGLYDSATPATVDNFKTLIAEKYYNGMRFHRVFPNSMVQTGDPLSKRGPDDRSGTGGPGYTVPAEIRKPHARGSVAMSRISGPSNPAKASSGSQFYVCLQPLPKLNGQYTVFGEVLQGLDVLEKISNARTDTNDFPVDKIVIRKVTLEPRGVFEAAPAPAAPLPQTPN